VDNKDLKSIKIPRIPAEGSLSLIWDLQLKLLTKYQVIEGLPLWPMNLDLKDNQELMKDFLARVVEELAESYEAFEGGNYEDGVEELADALHFMVEALIYSTDRRTFQGLFGLEENQNLIAKLLKGNSQRYINLQYWFWDVTYHLNIARNNLRNKRWKKTQVLAQKAQFTANLAQAFHSLIVGFKVLNLGEKDIFEAYYKKNKINQFRIRSNY